MSARVLAIAAALALPTLGCEREQPSPAPEQAPVEQPEPTEASKTDAPVESAAVESPVDRLLVHLPGDAQRVAYDRLAKPFDADVLEVVFAIPPQAGDLLDERTVLDEGLDIVLDGDAEPENWLTPASLAFVLPLGKTPYFLRVLSKPAAELGPLLEQGFRKSTVEGVDVWLPTGSFPWRVALLDNGVAAFVPIDTVGTGLEPLLAAREAEASPLEVELARTLKSDPATELVLFAVGPLVHLDVTAPIAQVDFLLRTLAGGYAGQVRLRPAGDVDECLAQLRARKHPEENQQVQALLGAVEFVVDQGAVVGQLELSSDRLKHFEP